jgi:hypothetical protein
MEPRHRLLTRVAPLAERDVRLVESGLRGKHPLVQLAPPRRRSRLDAKRLELVGVDGVELRVSPGLPGLDPVVVVPEPFAGIDAHVHVSRPGLDRDLALRSEARA